MLLLEFASSSDWNHENPCLAETTLSVSLLLCHCGRDHDTFTLQAVSGYPMQKFGQNALMGSSVLLARSAANKHTNSLLSNHTRAGDEQQKAETIGVGGNQLQQE